MLIDRETLAVEVFCDGRAVETEPGASVSVEPLDVMRRTGEGPALVVAGHGAEAIVKRFRPPAG